MMTKQFYTHFIFILAMMTSCAFMSCSSDEVQARTSLEGNWNIIQQTTYYGEFTPTSFNATEMINSPGGGNFSFTSGSVSYMLGRDSTTYIGNGEWHLEMEKVREGFFRTNQYTLNMDLFDPFVFDVSFEDGTHNAEKDATTATLLEVPTEETDVLIMLRLQKW